MVKANLCLFMGSKSFRPNTAGLAEERTPTRISEYTIAIVDLDILIAHVYKIMQDDAFYQISHPCC